MIGSSPGSHCVAHQPQYLHVPSMANPELIVLDNRVNMLL